MATLAFSAVGTLVGGPIGGAIGALVGRQVDAALFGPLGQGPRLKELAVTASSYGEPIPRHFGRMRVPGTIIWATDLVEHSEAAGGGKGAPSLTAYSYSVSFAVALCSRPIIGIGRIWADGKLLRGEAGDLKAAGTVRIYNGRGDQPLDPLMAAAEGVERCPAYRGLACVVFEDLDLSEFYNRIPALSFEVIADEALAIAEVFGGIEAIDASIPLPGVAGLTSDGPPARVLEAIAPIVPVEIDAGEQLVISRRRLQGEAITVPSAALPGADDAFGAASGQARRRAAPSDAAPTLLRYYDVERDYQPGVQRAAIRGGSAGETGIELPAALDAGTARRLIESAARRIDWSRDRLSWRTAELDTAVAPGTLVVLPETAGTWRVLEWEWREGGVELSLERVLSGGAASTPDVAADPGRASLPADLPSGATALVAFELPFEGLGGNTDLPNPWAAVSSASAGWSGAALYADRGDGELQALGPSGRSRSVIGTALSTLGPASPLLIDRRSTLLVSLIDPAMALASADAHQMALGANLAIVGNEIIQFGRVTSMGGGTWQIEALMRGRGGTEAAIAGHVAGEPFVLLSSHLAPLDPTILGMAAARRVLALGRADADPAEATVLLDGITLRPPAPVHPRRKQTADGGWQLSWTRRARGTWPWQDRVDMPLVEESERYTVTLGSPDAPTAMWTVSEPRLDIPASLLAELSTASPGSTFRVRQQGTHTASVPLTLATLP